MKRLIALCTITLFAYAVAESSRQAIDKWAAARDTTQPPQNNQLEPIIVQVVSTTTTPPSVPVFSKMSSISLLWGESVAPKNTKVAHDASYYVYQFETDNYKGFVKQGRDGSLIQCRKNKKGKTLFECFTKISDDVKKEISSSRFKELEKTFNQAKKITETPSPSSQREAKRNGLGELFSLD